VKPEQKSKKTFHRPKKMVGRARKPRVENHGKDNGKAATPYTSSTDEQNGETRGNCQDACGWGRRQNCAREAKKKQGYRAQK